MRQIDRFVTWPQLSVLTLLVTLITVVDARAQSSGEVVRANWPDVLFETERGAMHRPGVAIAENFSDVAILPFIDSLALAYDAAPDSPSISFQLRWVSGQGGILDGALVDTMPDSVWMAAIDLHADVLVNGGKQGDLLLSLDSLWLPSGDFVYEFSTAVSDWGDVFEGVSAEEARNAFEAGFELGALDVLSVAFEAPAAEEVREEVLVTRRPPRRRTIYTPDVGIWIGWDMGGSRRGRGTPVRSGNRGPRTEIGRASGDEETRRVRGGRDGQSGDTQTRSGSGEESVGSDSSGEARSGRKGTGLLPKGNDDDDDDRELLGPALGAAAAIGALAYFGGTVGYYGYPQDAPIGLSAGRITDRGGAMIHAAVSSDVLTGGGDERLIVGISGVFKPVLAGLHPVAGLDVWLSELGDTIEATPIVTAGVLLRTGGGLAFEGGVDLSGFRPRIGLSFSFR